MTAKGGLVIGEGGRGLSLDIFRFLFKSSAGQEKAGGKERKMGGNTFGSFFLCHSFGESHGKAMGVVVDGCPAGVPFSQRILTRELQRRRPGQNPWDSARREPDQAQVLSGVFEGKNSWDANSDGRP